jgi:hypothetical protein
MPADKIHLRKKPATDVKTKMADVESSPMGPKFKVSSDPRGCIRIIQGRVSISPKRNSTADILQSLRELDRIKIRYLFAALAPPKMEALAGEYDAELLDQGGHLLTRLTGFAFGMHGSWTGKAFYPVNANQGVGYNSFQSSGTTVRKLPMDTSIDQSMLDGRRSFVIRYQAKNRGLITQLFGEVRQLNPNIMLGIGIFDPTLGRLPALRRYVPFVMVGPCRPYDRGQLAAKTDQKDRLVYPRTTA